MSREHLLNLRNMLLRNGWDVRSQVGEESIDSLFHVEAEAIRWHLRHSQRQVRVDLVFLLFGHLGNPTEDLNDILYCEAEASKLILYFSKISKERWRIDSAQFVAALGNIAPATQ